MDELEVKKKKMYKILLSVFRVIMVLFFMYQIRGSFWEDEITPKLIGDLSVFILYVFGMLLLSPVKAALYLESIAVTGMIIYFSEPALISLFVFPLALSMIVNISKVEMVSFPTLLLVMIIFQFGWGPTSISFALGLFIFFFIKEYETFEKTEEIKEARRALAKKDEQIREQEIELMFKDKELETISNMFVRTKSLNQKINIEELIDDLISAPRSFFNAEYVALYVLDEDRYRLLKEMGDRSKFSVPKTLTKGKAKEIVITNEQLNIPITFESKPWGIISVFGKKEQLYESGQKVPSKFNEDDYETLALYVGQVMFSMSHAKLLIKFEDLANKDFLTKIPNRRHFMEEFTKLLARAQRGEELAVVVLDVDFFKKFNDTYGHDKGDDVLKIVAEALNEYVRTYDFVGRLGGEEFGVLIPNANKDALEIAERIRKKISLIPFIETITVSMGVAYYGRDGKTIDELYNNADKALYRAKQTGRNRVCEFSEVEE